tara:strand:+ start:813 stop:1316 length:504 start_codon:yes stop_codon:yes gene_type:complete
MKKTNHKKYDTKTDEKSRQAFKDIIKILEEYLKEKIELTISGSQDDFNGIDVKTVVTNKTIQIKNYVYCIRNFKVYSNTIVCPMKNYDEYIKNGIDYLFCSYYMDDNPTKIIQYGLIEINKLKNIKPDETNKLIHKSDHYVWNYSNPEIKKNLIIIKQYIDEDICLI